MDDYKKFLDNFELEKVESWDKYYIDYKNIIKEIFKLFRTKQTESETMNNEHHIPKKLDKEEKKDIIEIKTNQNDNIPTDNKYNNIIDTEEKNKSMDLSSSQAQIKSLFELLDKEVKKIHIFYSTKEKDIYQRINKKIKNKSKIIDKTSKEIVKEIDELYYISELSLQVLGYININIQALKSILSLLDNSLNTVSQFISYKYIKNFLSKDNSELIYILSFRTLDETIVSIQGILNEYKKVLKSKNDYKNNIELKNEYKDLINNIKRNISQFDETHEKIFSELTIWRKYLDMNLDLPSSSNNSIFMDTSLVGDYFEKKGRTSSLIKDKKRRKESNDLIDDKPFNINNLSDDFISSLKSHISNEISGNEFLSKATSKFLSKENTNNIKLLLFLLFFYFYSYFVIISKVLFILKKKILKEQDKNENKFMKYYGIIISLPSLGSLISQQYIKYLIKCNFKIVLVKSVFFVICHYVLYVLGIFFKEIYFLFIARFLLGLSSLDRLCKIYIDECIPIAKQAKINQKYLTYTYFGYFFGLIISDIEIIIISIIFDKKDNNDNINLYEKIEYLYSISGLIIIIVFIIVIFNFKNPTNKKFKTLDDSIINYSKENRLIAKLLENDEKEIAEKHDTLFENANSLSSLSGENILRVYSNEIEKKKSAHFKKVFLLLILFLFSSHYISENNLMVIPGMLSLEKNDTNSSTDNNTEKYTIINENFIYHIVIIFISISYLISLCIQKYFLKRIHFKKSSKIILLILFFLSILIISGGFWPYLLNESFKLRKVFLLSFPIIGTFFMIIISEFLLIVIINLFIGLLPKAKFKFLCINLSTFINIIDKISRLLPGTLYMIISYKYSFKEEQIYLYLLYVELAFIILSLFFCLCRGRFLLKSNSLTRISYIKN